MALPTFKEPSRERENTFQKRFKLSKANSQTDEKLLWMEDNWIGKEIKHSILKIGANGKKSRNGDTLGPVELIVWPEQGNQGDWREQDG